MHKVKAKRDFSEKRGCYIRLVELIGDGLKKELMKDFLKE